MKDRSYPGYRAALLDLFASVDPVRLIASGAPRDEYGPEVGDVLRRRPPMTADRITSVFLHWFGEPTGRISDADAARLAEGLESIRARMPEQLR